MDVGQSIIKNLELIGVDHLFGGSGHSNASLMLALQASEQIKTVIIRNEQAASFMACGYAMFSDKLGVCFSTAGPGAFNLFSGLAVAYSDSLPVLALTGYASAPFRGKGELNESTGLSRTPDSQKMFAATTKQSYLLEHPEQTCDILEEAVNLAYEGRPGPVHIHIPKNIAIAQVPNFREIVLHVHPVLPKPETIQAFSDRLAKAIAKQEQMALLIGYGAIRSHAEQDLLKFVEQFQMPFMTTMDAKGVLPETHPLSLGVYGSAGDPGANAYFERASLILAIGNSFAQNATFSFKPDLYDHKTLLHINIDRNEINKVYKADYAMISDIQPAIVGLRASLSRMVGSIAPKTIEKDKWYDTPTGYSSNKIHPGDLVKILSDNLPENAIVLGDAGAHMLWLSCYLNLGQNQRYQNPGSFGPMASHTNGAIGVKCANPDKVVISGSGDGCYLMAGFELLTAVQNHIPVIWVIFNNGEFNVIKKMLLNNFGKHAFMQFLNPDYVMYAKACGAEGYRVEKLADFAPALQQAIRSNKPTLIDVAVEAEVYPPLGLKKV